MSKDTQLVLSQEAQSYQQATRIAGICKEIILKTVINIAGKKYLPVEAWMSIGIAHGCIASIKSVTKIDDGILAVAEIKRQSDGQVLAIAEGFVGKDEPVWYGGQMTRWNKFKNQEETVDMPKRADYAIRSMAQTRAISKVCRVAYAHVVVMMNEGLSTTPYEEVASAEPDEGAGEQQELGGQQQPVTGTATRMEKPVQGAQGGEAQPDGKAKAADEALRKSFEGGSWKEVFIHFGQSGPEANPPNGLALGQLTQVALANWCNKWAPRPNPRDGTINERDFRLRLALDVAKAESKL